jgi:hypothetical protein
MTMNEKSPAATPSGVMAKLEGVARPPSEVSTARTMASRHSSVREAAQEFQIPAAQFSVSKYQLMPQTGTVAAMMAASGRPTWRPRPTAARSERRAARILIANPSLQRSQALLMRSTQVMRSDRRFFKCPRHALRSTQRVGLRHIKYTGSITSSVKATAISMSPTTATAGEMRPRKVPSAPIRPM